MSPEFEQLRGKLLERFRKTKEAHHEKDVELIIGDLGEGFFSMSGGEITYPTRDEQRKRFTRYLNNTTFSDYTSLMEPEIEFSDDGSIAWGKYRVKVRGETINEGGAKTQLDFICAWLWLYRRVDDKWVRIGEVSTWK